MKKRLICLVLVFIFIIVTFLPVGTTSYAATNNEIQSKISIIGNIINERYWNANKTENQLISAINRGDYSFGFTDSPCSLSVNDKAHHLYEYGCTSNTFNGGRQCAGFSYYMAYAVFGSKPSTSNGWEYYTGNNAKEVTLEPGDIVRYNGHSAMVWYTQGDTLYVAEANWWDNQKRWCQVHFGVSWYSVSQVKNNITYVWKHPDSAISRTPVDVGDNFYTVIFHYSSQKAITCEAGGTNVILQTYDWRLANQRWYAKRNGDGSYYFINADNNLYLEVSHAYDRNNANVQAAPYSGNDAQRWYIYDVNGAYIFMPKHSTTKVMDLSNASTADGTNIQIYENSYNDAQRFNLGKVECSPETPTITSNGKNTTETNGIYISWKQTDYTEYYNYYLVEYPEGYAYTTNTLQGNTTNTYLNFKNLTSGRYSCFIHAVSHQGEWSNQSNWITFNVYADDYIPTKTVVSDGHIYALYDYEMSWTFARDLCEDLGGNLVTVTSSTENQIITDLIQEGSKEAYWLGATDIDREEKDYAWVTGEEFAYNNWKSGEPNSGGEDGKKEHFVEIRKSYGNKWNDVNNINKTDKGFILEIDVQAHSPIATEIYNGNQYLLFDKNTTWSEAKVFCEQLGGHLATSDTEDESKFIKEFLKHGERGWYYLGGQKENNTWKWIDGRNADYISWADNASSWKGTNLMMYRSTGNCIGINNAYYPQSDIKNIGFVCEIERTEEPTPPPTIEPTQTTLPETTQTPEPYFIIDKNGTYADITNLGETKSVTVIIAEYSNGELLKNVTYSDVWFEKDEKRTFMLGNGNYKVFVWNSLTDMIPLAVYE